MRAIIASGSGRYGDPWHPFDRTSPLIANILTDAGFQVSVDEDVDHAMSALDGEDLVVVNAGDPWRGATDEPAGPAGRAIEGLYSAMERGIGIVAIHCAVSSLRDYPEWFPAIGGMWVPGLSFHPPAGATAITGGTLPDGTRIDGFDVFDECYCRIQRLGRSTPVAHHHEGFGPQPVAWTRRWGSSRVAVDLYPRCPRTHRSV